ncbi:MAG: excinuclease ABC subunit UvrC [Promethearchaeota archaeon]
MDTPVSFPSEPISPLEFKRKNLPDKPGCYLFKNSEGKVLYIGKAKSLKKRVNSYWMSRSSSEDLFYVKKIHRLVGNIADIDVFVVENEMEAILLENELIKKHQPEYNVDLKDDKSFPWVQITNEPFPRIRIIRNPAKNVLNHKYIGPFVDAGDLKRFLRYIRKIFPYCTCKKTVIPNPKTRPCVNYQLKLCPGPCCGKISSKDYMQNIYHIEELLSGNVDFVASILRERMTTASTSLKFEEAAVIRDQLHALEIFTKSQSIFTLSLSNSKNREKMLRTHDLSSNGIQIKDIDVIAGSISKSRAGMIIIHVRKGKLLSKTPYVVNIDQKLTNPNKYLIEFIQQHYLRPDVPFPDEIVLREDLPKSLKSTLQKQAKIKGKLLTFRSPSEEDKTAGLERIAQKNIELLIRQQDEYDKYLSSHHQMQNYINRIQQGLAELQEILHLGQPPSIIEGFDMAHFQGTDYTGSMVQFVDGQPSKSHYRHYRVKTITRPDDVAAMREVMERRYHRAIKEEEFPDLIVVDGGKAQLNMAHQLLQKLQLDHIPHIGLVKPEGRSEKLTPPTIILSNSNEIINLPLDSPALQLIQHLRDESHRFANRYHQKLRQKRQSKSELDEIPGIGPARKQKLLRFFGSVKEIRKASYDDLRSVVGQKIAQTIQNYFKQQELKKSKKSRNSNKKIDKNSNQNSQKRKIILKKSN